MIKIAILEDCLEDQKKLYTVLQGCIQKLDIAADIQCYQTEEEFLASEYRNYDLLFLDIELDDKNGIETAKLLRKEESDMLIVLVTNLMQYAISGYSIRAADYILKPIDAVTFEEKFSQWVEEIRSKKKELVFSVEGGYKKKKISELIYFEVFGHNLVIHAKNDIFTIRSPLKKMEEELSNYGFVKCNKCYLVNMEYVTNINENMVEVDGTWLAMSRREGKKFIDAFTRKIGI